MLNNFQHSTSEQNIEKKFFFSGLFFLSVQFSSSFLPATLHLHRRKTLSTRYTSIIQVPEKKQKQLFSSEQQSIALLAAKQEKHV